MPRVLISVRVDDEQMARLRAAAPTLDLVSAPGGIALRPPGPLDLMEPTCPTWHPDLNLAVLLPTIDAIIAYDLPPDLRARAARLRWVQVFHAGVDGVWQPYLAEPELAVTTVSGTHPIPMTEFVEACCSISPSASGSSTTSRRGASGARPSSTSCTARPSRSSATASSARCSPRRCTGSACASSPCSAHPIWPCRCRRSWRLAMPPPICSWRWPRRATSSVSCPRTPETEGLWNDATFAALPRGATFINIGRGRTVDEAVLLRALKFRPARRRRTRRLRGRATAAGEPAVGAAQRLDRAALRQRDSPLHRPRVGDRRRQPPALRRRPTAAQSDRQAVALLRSTARHHRTRRSASSASSRTIAAADRTPLTPPTDLPAHRAMTSAVPVSSLKRASLTAPSAPGVQGACSVVGRQNGARWRWRSSRAASKTGSSWPRGCGGRLSKPTAVWTRGSV